MKEFNRFSGKRKCIFISSPLIKENIPRGILSIASFLEVNGYPSEIIPLPYYVDFHQKWSSEHIRYVLKDFIQDTQPLLVGISNQFTVDYPICLDILKICKELNEDVITVIGGSHVTFLDMECIKSPSVDIIVRGEGEWTMLELISSLKDGTNLSNVKGITFKQNGKIIQTPNRLLGNLEELPSLDFKLLPFDFVKKSQVLGMLNRGCTFKCSFCSEAIFWKKKRSFPVERLVGEMETLNNVYGNPMHGIEDSMLHLGSTQFISLCTEIKKRKIRLRPDFVIESRVDTITDQGLILMKGTGIQTVWMGIESGSPKVLKMMNKKIAREQIIATCARIREHNFEVFAFWMIGHPGDNPAEAEYSLELLEYLFEKDLLSRVYPGVFIPFPGTKFFKRPEKYGIEILSNDWSEWMDYYDTNKVVCQLKDFSADEIVFYYKKLVEMIEKYDKNEWS